jgi:MoaA/NifB/PqqE/SkfB family radical SAM enzyme
VLGLRLGARIYPFLATNMSQLRTADVGVGVDPSLWLELTPNCNLSCAFCYNPWRPGGKGGFPASRAFDEICTDVSRLRQFAQFRYVSLSGGEPLLYRHLVDLTKWLAGHGERTILTTNGRLLSRERLDALVGSGLNGLQVSVLGSREATHDSLAGRSSWRQALEALARGRMSGLAVAATFIATARNLWEMPEVVELVASLGIKTLVVNEVQLVGSAAVNAGAVAIDASAYQEAVQMTEAAGQRLGVVIRPVRGGSAVLVGERKWAWDRWSLSPDGRLKLCNHSSRDLGAVSALPPTTVSLLRRLSEGHFDEAVLEQVDNCACMRRAVSSSGVRARHPSSSALAEAEPSDT